MMSSLFKTLITPFIGIMTNAHKNPPSMPDAVDNTAENQPQKRCRKPPMSGRFLVRGGLVFVLFVAFWGILFASFNAIYPLADIKIETSTTVLSKEGKVLRQFADDAGVFRQWIEIEEVSPDYLEALIQYEDRYFYSHIGVNPLATMRALWQWISTGGVVSGSSTLTMQVARLLYPHERTIAGKITQMFRALQLERHYSKAEILTLYLNLAPMGGNIEGIASASQRYFSKAPNALTLAESALLVALPQRPSVYRPDRYPDRAREARDKVLERLYHFGTLDEATFQRASQDPINYQPSQALMIAPLLAERLRRQNPASHRIESTINYELQVKLEAFLAQTSKQFPERVSSAILVVNNHTHEVESYLGSVDLFDANRAGFVDMVEAIRSPGSTLKPFAYGMGLDYGIIHEASLLTDVPRSFNGYEPQNFDRKFRGAVPMYRALQQSLNVPVVQVFEHLTPRYFLQKMRESGIRLYVEEPTLSMVLGGLGTTLSEQVRLFSALANGGEVYPLVIQKPARDADQSTMPEMMGGKRLLSEEASWIITKTLSSIHPPKRLNTRKVAWKTGTSYGYRDAWAIGTSPDWTVGVWIGRPDGVSNVGVLAGDFSAPMLFDIFNFLPKDRTGFIKPAGIIRETICWPSGRKQSQVPSLACEEQFVIDTIAGKVPRTLYDAKGETPHEGWPLLLSRIENEKYSAQSTARRLSQNAGNRALGNQALGNRTLGNQVGEGHVDNPIMPAIEGAQNRSSAYARHGVKIITLANESIIFKSLYDIPLEAEGEAPLRWYLDGRLLKMPVLEMKTLKTGIHRLSVQDQHGNRDQIKFEVRAE